MKFSNETRALLLEARIRKLSQDEKQNWNLLRKARRELAAVKGQKYESQED